MTVRYWSPLPPQHTGVADYSAALLEELSRLEDVVTNPAEVGEDGINLYHIGNNGFHTEAYRQAIVRPGVAVIHDAVLQHYFLGYMSREEYIDEFVYNYGEWYRQFAEELWRDREKAPSDARYFQWPMLRRLVAGSLGVIAHNPAAEAIVLRHAPEARVTIIPHLFQPVAEPDANEVARLRAGWGVPSDTLLVGVFGYLRETKRIPAILRAFERARMRGARMAMVVGGEFVSPSLERELAEALAQPGIIRRGHVSEDEFWLQAHAVDACISLRVPSAAESSGIATRLMGIGKAVFLTDGEELRHLPAASYIPVSGGATEEAELEELFLMLAECPDRTRHIGALARQHIEREHDLAYVAARYAGFLRAARAVAVNAAG